MNSPYTPKAEGCVCVCGEEGVKGGKGKCLPGTAEAGHDDRIDNTGVNIADCLRITECLPSTQKNINLANQSVIQSKTEFSQSIS